MGRTDQRPDQTAPPRDGAVMRVERLDVQYRTPAGPVRAVQDATFDLLRGETLAIVGESGCGKTTLALALVGLLPRSAAVTGGRVRYRVDGTSIELPGAGEDGVRALRWRVAAMVFQSALNAFNPLLRIRDHFLETAAAHGIRSRREVLRRAGELLELVQLEPSRVLQAYPHELSGGMRQRALLALALLLDPHILILDEPATALDILTQRNIIGLLRSLKQRLGLTLLLISHDLALAAELADRIMTMYAGRIVEVGPVHAVFATPLHPYTQALLQSLPVLRGELRDLRVLAGAPPSLSRLPPGCAFAPRCSMARPECRTVVPMLHEPAPGHMSACHFTEQLLEAASHGA
ncbi:ABC transporter ATP-binding protein [Carboxydochorda subterranea]|uniref:ABC transporter ATP-binding protein n=1 Tax=Carboxydichorda subterranea TaxID=3109565 RepID=A0ABZ1BTW7_9FIRM|nr:ABC transporter ATP-binding protein [Limnochorda sp. L945t]WRP16272.1 ABC transporter ATP-binding protein [Limnochorda sp. L945t]